MSDWMSGWSNTWSVRQLIGCCEHVWSCCLTIIICIDTMCVHTHIHGLHLRMCVSVCVHSKYVYNAYKSHRSIGLWRQHFRCKWSICNETIRNSQVHTFGLCAHMQRSAFAGVCLTGYNHVLLMHHVLCNPCDMVWMCHVCMCFHIECQLIVGECVDTFFQHCAG